MAPVFDKSRKTAQHADAVVRVREPAPPGQPLHALTASMCQVVASRVGMTKASLAVIGADGDFRSDKVELQGRIAQLVSDSDGGGNAALAITDEGTIA